MRASSAFAVVTGGTSGIGAAIVQNLLAHGLQVLVIARRRACYEAQRAALPASLADRLSFLALDVRDAAGLQAGLEAAIAARGAPDWVVTCAGVAEPGCFLDLPLASHETQWATNYNGTLNVLRVCAPAMVQAGSGRLVLISSAAALGTFYGYSAYSPSKFAVRALGDILRLELRPHGISVTTAFPPDTDTAQLAHEKPLRPPVAERFLTGNPVLSPQAVAQEIIAAADRGRAHVAPGAGTRLFLRMPRLFDAVFRWQQQRLAARLRQEPTS
jgi:3-dehydrosphinganine reductase